MFGSANQACYGLGVTKIAVGLSSTVTVSPAAGQMGGFFKINAGGGTLAVVQGASSVSTDGYLVGASEVVELYGPAKFFLAAAGATMTVQLVYRYSSGLSSSIV